MKRYTVYEIKNSNGSVIDVGFTGRDLEIRLWEHTHRKKGRHYNQFNLTINEVKSFDLRKDAMLFEGQLKIQHGLIWSEHEGRLGKQKLSLEDANEIRQIYNKGGINMGELGKLYNVSAVAVWQIINNKVHKL